MKPIRTVTHTSNNRNYEIRLFDDGGNFRIAAYRDDQQIGEPKFITAEAENSFHTYHGSSLCDATIEKIKQALDREEIQ